MWESISNFFTEEIPDFFTEVIPEFFTEEIPAFFDSFTYYPESVDSSSAAAPAAEAESYDILDMINSLNQTDRENAEASVAAQKELLALQNEMNSSAAELAWDRYKEFDSEKVQRYVADMRAAGINPIIAFGSGMPNISSATPSASSVSPWTAQKASAQGESAIGKQQQLVQGYVAMIASLLETGISTAGNLIGSLLGKSVPAPQRTSTTRLYSGRNYTDTYTYGS